MVWSRGGRKRGRGVGKGKGEERRRKNERMIGMEELRGEG